MTSENSPRRPRRSNGPLLDTVEELATGVARLGYGMLSIGLDLLPRQSRQHMHNAVRELSHAFATLPGDFAEVAGREIERWAAEEPAPARVRRVAVDSAVEISSEVEISTVSTLGAAAAESPALVSIAHIEFDPPGRDIDGEYVLIRNDGAMAAELTGWTLTDGGGHHSYTFPAFTLAPGAEVRVWSGGGVDDGADLFWGNRGAIWNNSGDSATLSDAGGAKMAGYSYEARDAS